MTRMAISSYFILLGKSSMDEFWGAPCQTNRRNSTKRGMETYGNQEKTDRKEHTWGYKCRFQYVSMGKPTISYTEHGGFSWEIHHVTDHMGHPAEGLLYFRVFTEIVMDVAHNI